MLRHNIHPELLTRQVRICLIGAGGTGSIFLSGLARLHLSLKAKGHPGGLAVDVYDPDTVSESNIGRQLFYASDIGLNKAIVLCHRLNMAYGLDFRAFPERFAENPYSGHDLYVSCVDSRASRREIHHTLYRRNSSRPVYWLDLGNGVEDGQVCLGEPLSHFMPTRGKRANPMRLPTITEFYPDLLDLNIPDDDSMPTCSLAEALERQSLFICQEMATRGLTILWNLFSDGGLNYHGQFTNLKSGRTTPLMIDKALWKRMIPKKPRTKSPGSIEPKQAA